MRAKPGYISTEASADLCQEPVLSRPRRENLCEEAPANRGGGRVQREGLRGDDGCSIS